MVRIEKFKRSQQEFHQSDERPKKKKMPKWIMKIIVSLVFFLILIAGGVWVAAASGLVSIPVVSSIVYEEPKPMRVVEEGVPVETYLSEAISVELSERLRNCGSGLEADPIRVLLTEASLTASLRLVAKGLGTDFIDADTVQVTVDAEKEVEFFVPIIFDEQRSVLRFRSEIDVKDGAFVVSPGSLSIGQITFPSFLTNFIVSKPINTLVDQLNDQLGSYANLQGIEIEDGVIILIGDVSLEKLGLDKIC